MSTVDDESSRILGRPEVVQSCDSPCQTMGAVFLTQQHVQAADLHNLDSSCTLFPLYDKERKQKKIRMLEIILLMASKQCTVCLSALSEGYYCGLYFV